MGVRLPRQCREEEVLLGKEVLYFVVNSGELSRHELCSWVSQQFLLILKSKQGNKQKRKESIEGRTEGLEKEPPKQPLTGKTRHGTRQRDSETTLLHCLTKLQRASFEVLPSKL